MLKITNCHARINEQAILKGLDLTINPGEVHAIMGPNGSGKSTLSYMLAGKPGYEVTEGDIDFVGENLIELEPEQRSLLGLFLAFQYPVEIPGVNNLYFLRTALNKQRQARGEQELDAMEFLSLVKTKMQQLNMDQKFLNRAVNEGFSGGEKKRNEILQMLVLEPRLSVLDEIDSGLDIDALQEIATVVNSTRDAQRSILMITHYRRLLYYIQPDFVHVMLDGRIVQSGDFALATELENKGYAWLEQA